MTSEPAVGIDIQHTLGTLQVVTKFQVNAPWTVLFGPSGSGKSTILRAIAGLVRPNAGAISVFGRVVSRPGFFLPAHRRRVRWAGQRAGLFPHMTVRQNVAIGAGFGRSRVEDELNLDLALSHFGLLEIGNRRPGELSGGQRQLVSVARAAMGAHDKVLLLDEPFSGLDARIRGGLILALRDWSAGPIISVTHDVSEAFLLGAEVVRVSAGRVVAQGAVEAVLREERERLLQILK